MPQLTEKQWANIVFDSLGIHGDNNATTVTGTGASFCMSAGVREYCSQYSKYPTLDMLPTDWYSQLIRTINWLKGFAGTTHLMLVSGSECDEKGYMAGCLPKSCKGAKPIRSIAIAGETAQSLAAWVINHIPEE